MDEQRKTVRHWSFAGVKLTIRSINAEVPYGWRLDFEPRAGGRADGLIDTHGKAGAACRELAADLLRIAYILDGREG